MPFTVPYCGGRAQPDVELPVRQVVRARRAQASQGVIRTSSSAVACESWQEWPGIHGWVRGMDSEALDRYTTPYENFVPVAV